MATGLSREVGCKLRAKEPRDIRVKTDNIRSCVYVQRNQLKLDSARLRLPKKPNHPAVVLLPELCHLERALDYTGHKTFTALIRDSGENFVLRSVYSK